MPEGLSSADSSSSQHMEQGVLSYVLNFQPFYHRQDYQDHILIQLLPPPLRLPLQLPLLCPIRQ